MITSLPPPPAAAGPAAPAPPEPAAGGAGRTVTGAGFPGLLAGLGARAGAAPDGEHSPPADGNSLPLAVLRPLELGPLQPPGSAAPARPGQVSGRALASTAAGAGAGAGVRAGTADDLLVAAGLQPGQSAGAPAAAAGDPAAEGLLVALLEAPPVEAPRPAPAQGATAAALIAATAATAGDGNSAAPAAQGAADQPRPVLQVPPALDAPEWGEAVGNRLLLQVREHIQLARLALNPPELGPVDVRVELTRDGANVSFLAASAQVREALEEALPRLREQFASAGLNLGQADVHSGRGEGERAAGQGPDAGGALRPEAETFIEQTLPAGAGEQRRQGLVDAYA